VSDSEDQPDFTAITVQHHWVTDDGEDVEH